MKIAVASSGLGHVARGIETWAIDTASALAERGIDVTLFSGASIRSPNTAPRLRVESLRCLKRSDRTALALAERVPRALWRLGLKSPYGWEQASAWFRLWPKLREEGYDILHVQDPWLAWWCERFRALSLVQTRAILAHGTEEPYEFRRRFAFLQELAPWHLDRLRQAYPSERADTSRGGSQWVAIPNFVDTRAFSPARDENDRRESRRTLGIPEAAFVVGCVAAVKRDHKRIDYLLREFKRFAEAAPERNGYLVVAGADQGGETEMLQAMAQDLLPGRHRFFVNLSRAAMPDCYRALDVFCLTSLFEMMPIALLEALASGTPAIVNDHPVLRWMVGADADGAGCGGRCVDMSGTGLSDALAAMDEMELAALRKGARCRAEALFAQDAVIGQYIDLYEKVGGRR